MDKFGDYISENELLLLRYYNDSLTKIKKQILEAAVSGHETTHLKQLQENVENELIKLNKKFQFFSKSTTSNIYKKGIKGQEAAFKQLHIRFTPVIAATYTQFAGIHKEAVKTLAINTYKPLKRVVDVIGRDCIEYFERTNFNDTQAILKKLLKFFPDSEDLRSTGLASVQGVVNGNITWQRAIKDFQETFMKEEIFKVPYYKKDGTLHSMVNMADYAELVARTTSAEAYRKGAENAILDAFDDMGDLVQINGHSQFPTSPCLPFEDAILSLTGKTKGYTTIDQAKAQGLFHPNCIHHFGVTAEVLDEYARIEAGNGQGTILNENGLAKEVQEMYTDNPVINGRQFKGHYSNKNVEKLKHIDDMLTSKGFEPSVHSVQRIFERTNAKTVLSIINNGSKYIDKQGNLVYYKSGITVHLAPNSKRIVTVVRRNPDRPLPKTWKKL